MVDNVQLPDQVEQGAKGGPRFKTNITTLSDGAETRNSEWARTRGRWDIGYGMQNKNDFSEVVTFFYAREGRNRGFLFKDWTDFQATDTSIGTGDGTTRVFQLRKVYSDSGNTWYRRITRPVSGTLSIKVNGVTNTDWGCNYSTGVLTFSTGHAPPNGHAITATFEFNVPVRFDTDELELEAQTFDAASIPSILIVELKE